VLITGKKLSSDGKTRMETMTATNDGFEIAEVDLKLRGPGNLMGTQQSGVLDLKIADLVKDNQILKTARSYAHHVINADPNVQLEEHKMINLTYRALFKDKTIWNYIS
jgi:ATP-dependent DNA helicase RecG